MNADAPSPLPVPVGQAAPDPERFWAKVRRTIGRIPFTEDLLAAWYCAIDRDTPGYVRAVLLGAAAYFVLPADVVPDFIAGLGYTDDASVIAAALSAVGRNITPRHRERARATVDELTR
jgi:uncharacterized membrane protein YkvA (DUF1232 family)